MDTKVSAKRRKIGGKIAEEAKAIRDIAGIINLEYVQYEIFHKILKCSEKGREIPRNLSLSSASKKYIYVYIIGQSIFSCLYIHHATIIKFFSWSTRLIKDSSNDAVKI
jgi:hypothetical protein